MPLHVRVENDIVILSNFGRLMNDPRYVDASRDAHELLEQGFRKFVLDLQGVRESGDSFLGLLVTLTRQIRKQGGEAVLAHLSRDTETFLQAMQMDEFWDSFPLVDDAAQFYDRRSGPSGTTVGS
jgi:anti-sigma B factor antagonist